MFEEAESKTQVDLGTNFTRADNAPMVSRGITGMNQRTSRWLSTTKPAPSGILQRKFACGAKVRSGGTLNETKGHLQHQAASDHELDEVPPIVYDVLRFPGQPLDSATRTFFEPRFGEDFSQVRIHRDSLAAASARSVNARAYTVGQHVVFADSQFQPLAVRGRQLLAHELTHVIQQQSHHTDDLGVLSVADPADHSEQQALANEQSVATGVVANQVTAPAAERPVLQRSIWSAIAEPFKAIARVFGAENYSDDDLLAYFNNYVERGQIENHYASDNKARAIINRCREGRLTLAPEEGKPVSITLSTRHKIVLGQELFQGWCSGADVDRMLDLLNLSKESELPELINGIGKDTLKGEKATAEFVEQWERRSQRQAAQAERERRAAEERPQPREKRPAEQLPFALHRSFTDYQLNSESVAAAIDLFATTEIANEVVVWLQGQNVSVSVIFVARGNDFPRAGSVEASGFHRPVGRNQWEVWVAAGAPSQDKESGQWSVSGTMRPEIISTTLFHELLHVWFKTRFPGEGTGHDAIVTQSKITEGGIRRYDEPHYDQRFLNKLKEFDAQAREAPVVR